MNLLAIDPGTTETALLEWDGSNIVRPVILPNRDALDLVRFMEIEHVVCEHLQCFGMPVGAEVFETAYFIGMLQYACVVSNKPFHRIYRRDVKLHICNSAKAKDANVNQALRDRFGSKGTKKNPGLTYGLKEDLWSAFAIAVTWFDQHQKT